MRQQCPIVAPVNVGSLRGLDRCRLDRQDSVCGTSGELVFDVEVGLWAQAFVARDGGCACMASCTGHVLKADPPLVCLSGPGVRATVAFVRAGTSQFRHVCDLLTKLMMVF